ncbi:MAG: hypothetical protein ACLGIO_11340 [Acidimicrobiia bacterium]
MRPTPGRRRVPPGRVLLAVVAVGALSACRAGASVEVEAGAGGTGRVRATVTLDREAARQVPDLADQLRADDLAAAGWELDGPRAVAGGGVTVRATKPFATPAGANRALEELGAPFASLRLRVDRGWWSTSAALEGEVDLSAGLAALGDEELAAVVGGPTLGIDPAAVERELGRPLGEVLAFELVADLPGRVDSNAPEARGGAAVWPVPLGGAVAVRAASEHRDAAALAMAGVAVLSGLALVVVLVRRSRRVSWG